MPSLRVLARRLLGRRGVFLARSMGVGASRLLRLYKGPSSYGRPPGISAMVCSYNESEWIEASLLSAVDVVDEFIVVDSSRDETPEIARRVALEHGLDVKIYRTPPGSLSRARNIALARSSYRWILHLDPDMVLYRRASKVIRGVVEGLDRSDTHYLVYWRYLLLCGDLAHLCREPPYHVEHWLFTWSPRLVYRDVHVSGEKIYDLLIAPLTLYKARDLGEVLGVHLNLVRRPERLALKRIWWTYRETLTRSAEEGRGFEEEALAIARRVYGVETLEEAGRLILEELVKDLPRYDPRVHGPLPEVLKEYIASRSREDDYYRWISSTIPPGA